ncbi:MAG: inositol monophosphatase [Nanoarchaeota archaeon]|nr:inositol monophosphatase [Nanoarchaeota archaeon]MBU1270157.1 inositol monophosphatase [Nanoarchaeota archaeon]MBU1603834.1 inositol monophosphatase [Nanoarchaeota archaeon]MBU2443302.1 inositol monophosphatase [Nanoarchaeota archaeon]
MDRLEFTKELAKKAGEYIKENYHKKKEISYKENKETVTQIDIGSEKIIIDAIKKSFPNENIWSEEAGSIKKGSDYTWVIDPLDGTNNYVFQIPLFSVNIGLWHDKKPVLGVIYFPITDELCFAEEGKGAFINGERIKVNKEKMRNSLFLVDSNINKKKQWQDKLISLMDKSFKMRACGVFSFNSIQIARGNAGLCVDFNKKPGDFAAPLIIVKEAGGKMTNLLGEELSLKNKEDIIITNGPLHDEVLRCMKK